MKDTKMKRSLWFVAIPVLILIAALYLPVNAQADEGEEGYVTLDLSEYILQVGGLSGPEEGKTAASAGYLEEDKYLSSGVESAKTVIYEGLKNRSEVIDVTGCGLAVSDLGVTYWGVTNMNPELFYVEGSISYSYDDNDYVTWIWPKYDANYTDEHVAAFNAKVDEIISGVDSSWPDIQKVLYLHDYLVTHAQYDETYSKYDAYNALVEGSAVCQGYALATVCLLKEIDVNVDLITSTELNHAWNLIELDGEYFYTDATWDDPLGVGESYCRHTNFMVSEEGLVATGHDSADWISKKDGSITYGNVVTSTKYMDWFWSDMITAVPMIGTKTGYLADGTLDIYDFSTGTTTSHTRNVGAWRTMENNGTYVGDFCSLAVADGAFCYTTHDTIYRMDLDGTTTTLYTLSSDEAALGRIYGLKADGRTLTYMLHETPYGDVVYSGTYRISTPVDNFVTRMYQQCLSRNPDQAGLAGWVSQLEGGYMNGAGIAEQFVFSKEMLSKNLSYSDFIDVLYRAMMGREADANGKKGWVNQLEKGYMTRGQVTKAFVESTEFSNICSNYGIVRGTYDASQAPIEMFVNRFYTLCLERNPDQLGLYGWVKNLKNQYMNGAQIAEQFFFSTEFVDKNVSDEKYIELLYSTLLGRTADESGKKGWMNQLTNGYMSREDIMKAFIESTEFTGICDTYGIIRGSIE